MNNLIDSNIGLKKFLVKYLQIWLPEHVLFLVKYLIIALFIIILFLIIKNLTLKFKNNDKSIIRLIKIDLKRKIFWVLALIILILIPLGYIRQGFVKAKKLRAGKFKNTFLDINSPKVSFWNKFFITKNALLQALDNNNPDEIGYALYFFRLRNDNSAIHKAKKLLKNKDFTISFDAASYLAQQKQKDSLPYLIKYLKQFPLNEYPTFKINIQHFRKNLKEMTGQDFGEDYEKWRTWWEKETGNKDFNWD